MATVEFAQDQDLGMWWVLRDQCPSPLRAKLLISEEIQADELVPVRAAILRKRPALPHETEYDTYIEETPAGRGAFGVWLYDAFA